MRKVRHLSIGTILACSFAAQAQTTTVHWAYADEAQLAIESHLKEFNLPGMSVSIYKQGREIFSSGAGLSDVTARVKAGPRTYFRLASVSKPLTAILALSLVEKGKLNLDKTLPEYVPGTPKHYTGTLRQMLQHLSGIRHYAPSDNFGAHSVKSAREAAKLFWNDPLIDEPGVRYSYSTHAYTAFAAALEKQTGQPYHVFAKNQFAKWGFPEIRPELHVFVKNRSQVFEVGQIPAPRDFLHWKFAGGGYEATSHELARFGAALIDGKILKQESLDEMFTTGMVDGRGTGYGLGIGIGKKHGRRHLGHSGGQLGASSYFSLYPEDRISIVVFTNRSGNPPERLADYLAGLALGISDVVDNPYAPRAPKKTSKK